MPYKYLLNDPRPLGAGQRFWRYMEHLAEELGHMYRHAGLKGYCTGLMLPVSRETEAERQVTAAQPTSKEEF